MIDLQMNIRRGISALVLLTAMAVPPPAFAGAIDTGTLIDGRLQQELSSRNAQDGERFTVQTNKGSVIYGHLSEVARANIGRKAHLKLNFDRIRFASGRTEPLSAKLVSVSTKAQPNYTRAAGTVLGGMIAGNIIGKALGTNAGGLFGAIGGGLLAVNTTSDIDVPAGSSVEIQLTEPLQVH
jgi:hypothetical protein